MVYNIHLKKKDGGDGLVNQKRKLVKAEKSLKGSGH